MHSPLAVLQRLGGSSIVAASSIGSVEGTPPHLYQAPNNTTNSCVVTKKSYPGGVTKEDCPEGTNLFLNSVPNLILCGPADVSSDQECQESKEYIFDMHKYDIGVCINCGGYVQIECSEGYVTPPEC